MRTIAEITAAIDALVKTVEDVDTFLHELRVAAMRPFDGYVVGYDWGMFLAARKSAYLGGVLNARKFASHTVASDFIITNGKGEVAKVMRHADALFVTIELQMALRANMMEMMTDLQLELSSAYEAEEMERRKVRHDYAERLRQATIDGDWELHARIWEERRVADVEADEAALAEDMERAADEGEYYDSFGLNVEALLRADIEARSWAEHERKGGYSLRAAAARIADSSSEYEG